MNIKRIGLLVGIVALAALFGIALVMIYDVAIDYQKVGILIAAIVVMLAFSIVVANKKQEVKEKESSGLSEEHKKLFEKLDNNEDPLGLSNLMNSCLKMGANEGREALLKEIQELSKKEIELPKFRFDKKVGLIIDPESK